MYNILLPPLDNVTALCITKEDGIEIFKLVTFVQHFSTTHRVFGLPDNLGCICHPLGGAC